MESSQPSSPLALPQPRTATARSFPTPASPSSLRETTPLASPGWLPREGGQPPRPQQLPRSEASASALHPPSPPLRTSRSCTGASPLHLHNESIYQSPPPAQQQISALIKAAYHPCPGPCQTAGDSPVLEKGWQFLTECSGPFWPATSIAGPEQGLLSQQPWNQPCAPGFSRAGGAQWSLGSVTEGDGRDWWHQRTCVGTGARRHITEGGSMSSAPGLWERP